MDLVLVANPKIARSRPDGLGFRVVGLEFCVCVCARATNYTLILGFGIVRFVADRNLGSRVHCLGVQGLDSTSSRG